jgi:threonine dehydrogenase-like Zn-dependent dehydrogenase
MVVAAREAVETMAAAVLDAPGRAIVARRPVPETGPGQVLVRVEGCGVCASSLPLWEGRPWFEYPLPPGAPGHEAWGEVVAGDLPAGTRVAFLSQAGFAELDVAAADQVVVLPAALGRAAFPGEAVGCALNAFARGGVRPGETVAVVGAGFLGLLLVQLSVDAGARVVAFSRRRTGLELAARFGAEGVAVADELAESCDVVFECGGVQETLDLASRLVRTRGRLAVAGYHQDGDRRIDLRSWNWRGIDVVNAHEREPAAYVAGMREAVAAALAGRIDLAPLVTHTLPLGRLAEAFELLRTRPEGFVKAVVRP